MRRVVHEHPGVCRGAVRGQRRAQDGGEKLFGECNNGCKLLLDGPELCEPELSAMRRRGVRRHAPLGHEPRDGHVRVVQGLRWWPIGVRGLRL